MDSLAEALEKPVRPATMDPQDKDQKLEAVGLITRKASVLKVAAPQAGPSGVGWRTFACLRDTRHCITALSPVMRQTPHPNPDAQAAQEMFGKSFEECEAHERVQVGGKVRGCATAPPTAMQFGKDPRRSGRCLKECDPPAPRPRRFGC